MAASRTACYGKSVRRSVSHTLVLYLNKCIYRQTLSISDSATTLVFLSDTAITQFQGESPPQGR